MTPGHMEAFDRAQQSNLWEKPWLRWQLCTLAVIGVLALWFLMSLVPDRRPPIADGSHRECAVPAGGVVFDVIGGIAVERSPSQGNVKGEDK